VGGFVYTNNSLQFFSSPEGRVIKKGAAYEYQYAIADHQGNTRVVFSSAPATPVAVKATFEGDATDQSTAFANVSNVVTMVAANQTAGGSKVVRMNQGYSVGPSKSMKVFTGDKIDVEVYAYYEQSSGWGTTNAPLTTLVTAIAGAFGGVSGAVGESGSIFSGVNTALGGFGLGANAGDGAPSAFLNYILFDKNYKVMNMGWKVVPTTARFAKQRVTLPTINVKEAGYLFTYLSYEDQSNNYVYFDDYKVTYTPTNIVQYNEYYPYGLQTATSWTRENATGNNFLGNGGTELNTTTSLYDLEYRNYDPALARMHQVDPMADKYASYTPYNYSFNAPSNYNDVNGADPSPGEKDYVRRPPLGEYHSGNDFSWLFRGSNMMSMFDRGWSPSRNTMADVGGMTGEQYSEAYEIFNNGKSFVPEFSYKEWVYPDGKTSLPYDVRLTGFVEEKQEPIKVIVTNNVVGYSLSYGYPDPVLDQSGKGIMYTIPVYEVIVAGSKNGKMNYASFTALRFGVSTKYTGLPHVVGVESGNFSLTWNASAWTPSGGWHINGTGGKDLEYIHAGPSDWVGHAYPVIGCVAIGGNGEWNAFNNFISSLDPAPVSLRVQSASTPALIDSGHRYLIKK
jgi:RHS repeat-associated protein